MSKTNIALMMGLLLIAGSATTTAAETESFLIEPSGAQLELLPGHASTTGFLVKAATDASKEKVLLTLADWEFNPMGAVVYKEPGTTRRSAASWLSIEPVSLPLGPGDVKLVRVAIRVPNDAAPGVYTSSILVTKTPPELSPAIPDLPGTPRSYCAFTVLITVRSPLPNHGVDLTMIPR